MLRAAELAEIIQCDITRLVLLAWVGSAAFETDRLSCMFGTIELQVGFCPILDGRDAINFKPAAKPLEIVSPLCRSPWLGNNIGAQSD